MFPEGYGKFPEASGKFPEPSTKLPERNRNEAGMNEITKHCVFQCFPKLFIPVSFRKLSGRFRKLPANLPEISGNLPC